METPYIEGLIERARAAADIYETYTQEQVDTIVKSMLLAIREHAEELAIEAVEESGYGDVQTKVQKNLQATNAIWYALKNKKTVGVVDKDPINRLVYVAKPLGVLAAITPSTNPSTTMIFNAAYALKTRNALIFSPHPGALKTSLDTAKVLMEAASKAGAPEHILQIVEKPSSTASSELLARVDTSLVAGAEPTVKSAYMSGKPAIGVSHGNVQTIVDRGSDLHKIVKESIESASFDNGLICACCQSLVIPEEDRETVIRYLREEHAAVLTQREDIDKLRGMLFPDGKFNRLFLGKSASTLAEASGLDISKDVRLLVLAPEKFDAEDVLLAGEMAPVCTLQTYDTFDTAIAYTKNALQKDGKGHSAVIYSEDMEKIERLAIALPITRVLVNQPGIYAANQQLKNGLNPTANLACGSWANNSFSENISYRHLMNYCRIAWLWDEDSQPKEEDIWA